MGNQLLRSVSSWLTRRARWLDRAVWRKETIDTLRAEVADWHRLAQLYAGERERLKGQLWTAEAGRRQVEATLAYEHQQLVVVQRRLAQLASQQEINTR